MATFWRWRQTMIDARAEKTRQTPTSRRGATIESHTTDFFASLQGKCQRQFRSECPLTPQTPAGYELFRSPAENLGCRQDEIMPFGTKDASRLGADDTLHQLGREAVAGVALGVMNTAAWKTD